MVKEKSWGEPSRGRKKTNYTYGEIALEGTKVKKERGNSLLKKNSC